MAAEKAEIGHIPLANPADATRASAQADAIEALTPEQRIYVLYWLRYRDADLADEAIAAARRYGSTLERS